MTIETLPDTYRVAFEENLRIDAAQKESRLSMCVDAVLNYSEKGDRFTFDYVGNSDPVEMKDRYGELPDGSIDERRRVGFFKPYHDGKPIGSNFDMARQVADPTNAKVVAMRRGLARHQDARIFATLVGTSYTGREGASGQALPAAQKIAVNSHDYFGGSGNVGLTVSKIMTAKVMFDQSEIEGERHLIATSAQIAGLLTDDRLSNADYNTVKALVNGEINFWHGFNFIRYENTGTFSGGTHGRAVAVIKDAVQYRQRTLHAPDAWLRKDKVPHWYAYYQVEDAGARGEDKGVIEIACAA